MKLTFFSRLIKRITFLGLVVGLLLVGMAPSQATAQVGKEEWTPPVNLSQSGAATNPVMVVDSSGTIHVIWQDLIDGFIYTKGNDEQWDAPTPINPPFEIDESEESSDSKGSPQKVSESAPIGFIPVLITDSRGNVHAFWTNEENELLYSAVDAGNLATSQWSAPTMLADLVLAFDVAIDSNDRLHISYVRTLHTADSPAGVYYQSSRGQGGGWSTSIQLYASPYFRMLLTEDANVEIATTSVGESQLVYVAWDNRPRNRVFLSRSSDGGATWNGPIEVAGPKTSLNVSKPHDIKVAASNRDVLLIWQEGEVEVSCRQLYQVSTDSGENWGTPESMLDDIQSCPQDNRLTYENNGLFLLQSSILDQTYLLAWDGLRWSDPQLQQALSNFIDPDTNNSIDLQCRQSTLAEENRLYIVGCDADPSADKAGSGEKATGGDIWITSRNLETISDWFPRPSGWKKPLAIASDMADISSLNMIADRSGLLHALWIQQDSETVNSRGEDTIYYARWDGENWSVLSSVLSPPFGRADQLSTVIDARGRLFVVWSGGQFGEIYFSWANAGVASSTLEWAAARLLPLPGSFGSSPDIMIQKPGIIYVTYAIPLNEDRGIYLTYSSDAGQNWSEPIRIFDGVAAGWAMVDQPHLSQTPNGDLHILWTRFSLPNGQGPIGLYYARSEDRGRTWSLHEEVTEASVSWSEIRGDDAGIIHRVWQDSQNDLPIIWFEVSLDSGFTWSRPTNISGFGTNHGSATLIVDRVGQVHLLQISEEVTGNLFLREWIWVEDQWTAGETLKIGEGTLNDGKILAADITSDGLLAVLIFKLTEDPSSGEMTGEVVFTGRSLDLPASNPIQLQFSTPGPQLTIDITPTPEPSPTSTQVVNRMITDDKDPIVNTELRSVASSKNGALAGVISAGVIILIYIFVGKRARNNFSRQKGDNHEDFA